jgi:hypothetical protein
MQRRQLPGAHSQSPKALIALFQAAFPDTPKRRIATDIEDLIAFLSKRRLIVRTDRK